jgi:hypothetical protein
VSEIEDLEIQLLLEALYQRYHYDFRHYARASIKRRLVQARTQLGFASVSAMQDRVLHDPAMLPRRQPLHGRRALANHPMRRQLASAHSTYRIASISPRAQISPCALSERSSQTFRPSMRRSLPLIVSSTPIGVGRR